MSTVPSSLEKILVFIWIYYVSLVTAQSSTASLSGSSSSGSSFSGSSSSGSGSVSGSGGPITPGASRTSGSSISASSTTSANLPSLSGYSTCVVTCFETAIAEVNCTNVAPENCYCNNSTYQGALISCMQSNCPSDLATAESLTNKFCALANTSTSISFSITSLPSSSSSSTSSASSSGNSASSLTTTSSTASSNSSSSISSAAASSTSNAASAILARDVSRATVVSVGAAVLGAAAGVLFVH